MIFPSYVIGLRGRAVVFTPIVQGFAGAPFSTQDKRPPDFVFRGRFPSVSDFSEMTDSNL